MRFFEMIQRAAMEKTHSSAIAWIFSDSNEQFDNENKQQLISALTGTKIDGEFVNVFTEYKGIDVLLEYKDHVVAIENKIKITEHDGQLKRYDYTLKQDFQTKTIVKVYLALIEEKPCQDWIPLSYDTLLEELNKLSHSASGEIINDYLDNLKKLVECKSEFLRDHRNFANVFNDGSKKKFEKTHQSNASAQYISDNSLETILQRAFFLKLSEEVNKSSVHLFIGETRGNALLDYKNPSVLPRLLLDKQEVDIGIQFQKNTYKIQFENGLEADGKKKQKNQNVRKVLDKYIKEIYDRLGLHKDHWRINSPKNRNSAYYSFSKKIPFNSPKSGLAENSFEDCVESIKKAFRDCEEVLPRIERKAQELVKKMGP